MKEIFKRLFVVITSIVFIMYLFAHFIIYKPMREELEYSVYKNFQEIANSKYDTLINVEKQALSAAASISSRSMIRNKILEYLNNDIEYKELVSYTEEKYKDGIEAVKGIVFAKRTVSGKIAAKHINTGKERVYQKIGNIEINTENDFKYYDSDKYTMLYVKSYIFDDDTSVYDEIYFDITDEMIKLNRNDITVQITQNEDITKLLSDVKRIGDYDDISLYELDEKVYYFKDVGKESKFIVMSNKKDILSTLKKLESIVFLAYLILFVLMALLVYAYIVIYFKKKIKLTENRKEEYRKLAYTDRLTGIYSRMYLEYWIQNLMEQKKTYYVVMIDVDKFKKINDERGHLVGDEVLKIVAKKLYDDVQNGTTIRFGGDEFLIIIEDKGTKNLNKLMGKISTDLKSNERFSFPIYISWGVEHLAKKDKFIDVLEKADAKMYLDKKRKKN